MTCANKIAEHTKYVSCWLPKDPNSPFDLCVRCTHLRVGDLLREWKDTPIDFSILENKEFQKECINVHHHYSLILLLQSLCSEKNPSFETVYTIFMKYNSFQDKVNRQIATHNSSTCTPFCHYHFKHKTFISFERIGDLPLNCWSCLEWILREKNCLGLYGAFNYTLLTLNLPTFTYYKISSLIDIMISLEMKGKGHAARILFDQYRRYTKDDKKAKEVLHLFLSQPAMIQEVFKGKTFEYYPITWRESGWKETLQKDALKFVRKRNWVFKEELMMRTWAPHRLLAWCFDIEELKDFDNPFEQIE